ARRVLENLKNVLASAGCTFGDVIKATVFVVDLADFPKLNALYAEAMGDHRPARSTVQVAALPKGALVEIELIAKIPAGGRGAPRRAPRPPVRRSTGRRSPMRRRSG